jgi:hypothetical protein
MIKNWLKAGQMWSKMVVNWLEMVKKGKKDQNCQKLSKIVRNLPENVQKVGNQMK